MTASVIVHIAKDHFMAKSAVEQKRDEGREILLTAGQDIAMGDSPADMFFMGEWKGKKEGACISLLYRKPAEPWKLVTYAIPDVGVFADQHETALAKDRSLNGTKAVLAVLDKHYKLSTLETVQPDLG